MADYKSYLAASILTEEKVVTYRLLSRTLKVHVNTAKEMLYDFHRQQNAKKPGAVHATYLVSGTKRKEEPAPPNGGVKKDGDDDYMQSSPFMSSSIPQPEEISTGETSVLTISLVREEELDELRSKYDHISSIHVYSVGPHPLKDLQILSDVTREIQDLTTTEDPLESYPKYGTILNPNVKRRTAKHPPPPPAAATILSKSQTTKPKPAELTKPTTKQEPKISQPSTAKDFFAKGQASKKTTTSTAVNTSAPSTSSKESTPNPPTLKRDSSSIFKAFAKAKPKLNREGTDSSTGASPVISAAEDEPMKDIDDDDEEETYVPPAPKTDIVDKDRKSRKEREEKLRKMMDEEDEEEIVSKAATPEVETPQEKEASVEPKEEPVVVSGGRRRGRKRVTKKKTVKDEEGYLVTKEELVWESFSEDEPAPKPKPKVQPVPAASKPKKGAAKPGQGNIMSFFGKK